MDSPHEVSVFTCEEILFDLFGEKLTSIPIDEVKMVFAKWLVSNNVLFFVGHPQDANDLCKAILQAASEKKHIIVMSESYVEPLDDQDDEDDASSTDL